MTILGLLWSSIGLAADDSVAFEHFENRIRPLLLERCVKCHGPEKQLGGLRLDTRSGILKGGETGPVLASGKPEESRLLQAVTGGEMPPSSEPRLTERQLADLRKWLAQGAALPKNDPASETARRNWREHWAFHKPDREAVVRSLPIELQPVAREGKPTTTAPEGIDPRAGGHPIDAFLFSRLGRERLKAAPRADRRTLIRRASFDLVGLPPSPKQVEKFASDESPEAWETLLNELLASPQYGERWGRHWLDVARYADSGGYETDIAYRNAWRYRDYVVKSFNDDKPYDRFVQEQIAGDELWPDNLDLFGPVPMAPEKVRALEAHTGTGFFTLGPQIHESNNEAPLREYERLTDAVDGLGAAFLGLTLGCSRCHDHKFDPLTQQDYFALQTVFSYSREIERPILPAPDIADFKQHYPRVLAVAAARKEYQLFEQSLAGHQPTPDEERRRQELLAAIGQRVLEIPERSAGGRPFDGLFEVPTITVFAHERPELVKPVRVLNRGELNRPGDVAHPALPEALAEATDAQPPLPSGPGSRKELALWLTRPEHPLTPRVMVNRVWQWHFGRGLVSTASDFGHMGQPPTHPELLDWLATEFVAQGWSVKTLHRLIMTSETYRLAGRFSDGRDLEVDPDNRLLSRFPRRRLEGEAVWDAMHAVAGTLNLQMGGPPVMPPLSDEEQAALRERYRWIVTPDPAQHNRRGMYIVSYRNFRFPLFEVFDAPNSAVSSPGRDVSTVAPQSLWLLNNPTAWLQAQKLAGRALRDTGDQPAALVDNLWRIALGRPANASESVDAVALFERLAADGGPVPEHMPEDLNALAPARANALSILALGLFQHNEFLFID